MDVRLTDEQRALQGAARDWLAQRFPIERLTRIADAPPVRDADLWHELATMGWTGLGVPESVGGGGATLVEEALVAEECGRGLLPAPLLSTAIALPLLDDALIGAVVAGERAVTLARGDFRADGSSLAGRAEGVADLPWVTDVVVTDGTDVWAVDLVEHADAVATVQPVDGTRPIGHLQLDGVPATRLSAGPSEIEAARLRGLVLIAAESVGVGQRCLELGVEHARQREQFGRPIGSYQGVGFALADSYAAVEYARSLTYWAAWAGAVDDPQAAVAASAARVHASDAAVFAAERAIQTYGGLGMTWDAPVHRWYKRALASTFFDGATGDHRDVVAASLLGAVE